MADMKPSDRVEVYYPDGIVAEGEVANYDQHTVTIRMISSATSGAIIVPMRRLKPQGQDRWRLDL